MKKIFRVGLFIMIISCISVQYAGSQEYYLREYGVKDGLPQSQISHVLQDSRGFLWIATRNGLSRFDGVTFINYSKRDGLPSNIVNNMYEDVHGRMWVVSSQGLSEFTGKDFRFFPDPTERVFVSAITGDSTGIFILSKDPDTGKSSIVRFENGIYSEYSENFPEIRDKSVYTIYYDLLNSELLFTDTSFILWSCKNSRLKRISTDTTPIEFIQNRNGRLVCGNRDSIYEYNNGSYFPYVNANRQLKPGALIDVSPGTSSVEYFDGMELFGFDLPFRASTCFIERERTLWFPSETNLFSLPSLAFKVIANSKLGFSGTWAICEDSAGNLWLGTIYGDLYMYDGTTMTLRNDYKKLFEYDVVFYKGSRLISNGELWFSLNCGVLIWDGLHFSKLEGLPAEAQVCYIYEDVQKNQVYIGTSIGLFIKDLKGMRVITEFTPNRSGIVEGIAKGSDGRYWMSGHQGISIFDGENPASIKKTDFPEIFSWTIEYDNHGGIWACSDDGLFYCNEKETSFTGGLPIDLNKPANSLKMIGKDHLLVGRAADICLIDVRKFHAGEKDYFRIYDITDGYPGDDCIDNGIVISKEGYCWILTSENIVQFFPDRLKKNLNPPSVLFTGLNFESDSSGWQPLVSGEFYYGIPEDISLTRNQNRVKISFTAISMSNPEKVRFRYQLKGAVKNNWSAPSAQREVIYENLLPGKYCFSLKAINADGIETAESSDLYFTIRPALHETAVFRIAFILVLLAGTFYLSRYLAKRNQKKREEAAKLKSHILKLQMDAVLRNFDPHFTFNAISSVGSLIMKSRKEDAYKYLTMLSSLLRTTLQDRTSVLKPLDDELAFVNQYCELQRLRFGERFDFSIKVGDNVDRYVEIPKMLIQIFVENAIKHGIEDKSEGGRIDIEVEQSEECLTIRIRDNGIGRKESGRKGKSGTGTGLSTVKKIFDLENWNNTSRATFIIRDLSESDNDAGTEVVITIPAGFCFSLGREAAEYYPDEKNITE